MDRGERQRQRQRPSPPAPTWMVYDAKTGKRRMDGSDEMRDWASCVAASLSLPLLAIREGLRAQVGMRLT